MNSRIILPADAAHFLEACAAARWPAECQSPSQILAWIRRESAELIRIHGSQPQQERA